MPMKMKVWPERTLQRSIYRQKPKFLAEYCKHAGRDGIENWHFYLIYNMFRSAGIIQGVYKRGLDGNASSKKLWSMLMLRERVRNEAGPWWNRARTAKALKLQQKKGHRTPLFKPQVFALMP